MTPQEITELVQTVAILKSQMVTTMDVVKVVGAFMTGSTTILVGATFYWMRFLQKNSMTVVSEAKADIRIIVKENKDDIRAMLKEILAIRMQDHERRLDGHDDVIEEIRKRINSHFENHQRSEQ